MLITFEGIDGAGKSTQIAKLVSVMASKGIDVLTLREPGGTATAEKIRMILLENSHNVSPIGELLLFSASRAELLQEVIIPALADGKTVILDRFFDSTTAYQGYGRGINLALLQSIIAISTCGIVPDITIYLDIKPEDALRRKFAKTSIPLEFEGDELDRMERSGVEFYRKVYEGYHAIIQQNPERFISLNALETIDTIHQHIIISLNERGAW